MVLAHAEGYGSKAAARDTVSSRLGISREALRRWLNQAEIDAGARPGARGEEPAQIRALNAERKQLREANAILRQASIFFAPELDPHRRSSAR
jgi:transposase